MKRIFLIPFIAMLMCKVTPKKKLSIEGDYKIKGTSENTPYEGTLTITKRGEVYQLSWYLSNSEHYNGVGILNDGILCVSYINVDLGSFGTAMYKVDKNMLRGVWVSLGESPVYGKENAIKKYTKEFPAFYNPSPSSILVEGTYKVKGKNQDGSSYKGMVRLTKKNGEYEVKWESGGNFYGIGLVDGDVMSIGWIDEEFKNFGVSWMKIKSPEVVEGFWATWGINNKGKETWRKMK